MRFETVAFVQSQRSGGILVAVLGLMFLATIVVLQFVASTMNEMRYQAQREERVTLRPVAYDVLETTLAVIHEFNLVDEGLHSPAQGWSRPAEFAGFGLPEGVTAAVRVIDESGQLPLEALDEQTLQDLLDVIGVPFSDAEIMVDSLLDWQDEDDETRLNGAEERWYEREREDVRPSNQPLQNWEELRRIRGFRDTFFDEDGLSNEYYRAFTSAVSLHHRGLPNINTAPPLVLEYIGEQSTIDPISLHDYLDGPDGVPGTPDDEFFRSRDDATGLGIRMPEGVGYETQLIRVEVEVRKGPAAFHLSALVEPKGSGGDSNDAGGRSGSGSAGQEESKIDYPFRILNLVENRPVD